MALREYKPYWKVRHVFIVCLSFQQITWGNRDKVRNWYNEKTIYTRVFAILPLTNLFYRICRRDIKAFDVCELFFSYLCIDRFAILLTLLQETSICLWKEISN